MINMKNFLNESAVELHDTLNPKLWTEGNELKPFVRDRLLKVVDKYIESSEVLTEQDVIDVELLGSNASYNYTPYSDLDVHLVVNMEAVSCDPALFQLACNAERSNFNKNYDITIKGIEIEMYVEDVKASTASNGIFSLYDNAWIKFPEKIIVPNYDEDKGYNFTLNYYKNLACKVLDNATTSKEVQDYINNLYNLRRTSIMTDGEFGKGNLIFKEIRNLGLLDELKQRQYELSSKELSLESLLESEITLYRGIDKGLEQFDKDVEWWTPDYNDAFDYGPGGSDDPEQADVLQTKINFSSYKTLYSESKDIIGCYLNKNVLDVCNLNLEHTFEDKYIFYDRVTTKSYTVNNNLQDLQRFINSKLKEQGYDFFVTQFELNGKKKTEVAVLTKGILKFTHPDWYTEKLFDKSNSLCYNLNEEYSNRMFIETPDFTKSWRSLGLNDEHLQALQNEILSNPEEGDIIKDSGGARKLRIQIDNNKGKSGGARVIYVDFIKLDRIYLLAVYPKSKQETLTQSQVNSVKKLVKSLKNEGGN